MRIITLPFCVRGTFYRVKVKDAHPAMAGCPLQGQVLGRACVRARLAGAFALVRVGTILCEVFASTMNDSNLLSAVEMAEQVRARAVSPVELVDAHLGRIAELNAHRESKLNAFVHVDVDGARAQANIAEAAVGPGRVPILIRLDYCTACRFL